MALVAGAICCSAGCPSDGGPQIAPGSDGGVRDGGPPSGGTDGPLNDGGPSGGDASPDGATCDGGPTLIGLGQHVPGPVSVSGGYLYWIDTRSAYARVRRVPTAGGPVTDIADPGFISSSADLWDFPSLTADSARLYWVYDENDMGDQYARIYATPLAGGPVSTVVAVQGSWIVSLVRDGGTLFYSDGNGVWSVPTGGGPPVQLSSEGDGPLAQDSEHLYLAERRGPSLQRITKGGGRPTILAGGLARMPLALAVDEQRIYLVDEDGSLRGMAKNGGPMTVLHAAPAGTRLERGALLVQNGRVYWSSPEGLARVNSDGSGYTLLHADRANALAADATYVYWTSLSGDEIRRICQ